jgi:hypothetical protein
MPTQFEEVIVHAYSLNPQNLLPDCRDNLFEGVLRGHVSPWRFVLECIRQRQSAAVNLAVGRQR